MENLNLTFDVRMQKKDKRRKNWFKETQNYFSIWNTVMDLKAKEKKRKKTIWA